MPVSATWLRILSANLGRIIPAAVVDDPIKNWRREIDMICLPFSGFSNMLSAQLRLNLPNPLIRLARYKISYSNYDFADCVHAYSVGALAVAADQVGVAQQSPTI